MRTDSIYIFYRSTEVEEDNENPLCDKDDEADQKEYSHADSPPQANNIED